MPAPVPTPTAVLLIEILKPAGIVLLTGAIAAVCVAGSRPRGGTGILLAALGTLLLVAGSLVDTTDVFRSRVETLLAVLTFALLALDRWRPAGALEFLAAVFGAQLVGVEIAYSHAAAEPGLLPVVANAVHWVVTAAWAGAAAHLVVARPAPDAGTVGRYATLSLAALLLAAASGGLLGFVHVHNADALAATAYGLGYRVKLGIACLLLLAVTATQFAAAALARGGDEQAAILGRARRRLRIEALLLFLLVLASGFLATKTPPGLAPFLNPQTWRLTADGLDVDVGLQPVAGRLGRARLQVSAPGTPLPDATRVSVSMRMRDGNAGQADIETLPVGPGEFLAETVLAMPGIWHLEVTLELPDGTRHRASRDLLLPPPPLTDDIRATLTHRTITYNGANVVTFVIGILLIATGAWGYALGVRGRAPAWLVPSSLAGAALGGLLILSVSFVKTYPTSFDPNPVPYRAQSIRAGETLYRLHCGECHGPAGRGDGPWAVANRGSIPDLTSPHMDSHTDGEMFWWIRHGIPSLDMPAADDALGDDDIWAVINFTRSLRHGMPPE